MLSPMANTMIRLLPRTLILAALAPTTACSESPDDRTASGSTPPPPATLAAEAPPIPIPSAPPSLPPGSLAIKIRLSGAPDQARLAERPGILMLRNNDTEVAVAVAAGDSLRSMLEKVARRFLADGWTLHLEPGESPSLYLYLPPGEVNLGMSVSSQVPGVGISWSL